MPKRPARDKFDQSAEVRKLARERVGPVKPAAPIVPKDKRKKPKHKKQADPLSDSGL